VPFNLFPRIMTFALTLPDMGAVSTQGTKPTDKLKIVPSPLDPSLSVTP